MAPVGGGAVVIAWDRENGKPEWREQALEGLERCGMSVVGEIARDDDEIENFGNPAEVPCDGSGDISCMSTGNFRRSRAVAKMKIGQMGKA